VVAGMVRYVLPLVLYSVFLIRYPGVSSRQATEAELNPLTGIRQKMHKELMNWLPGDSGPLASGILLGGNEGLSYSAKAAFRQAGLLHVTAASGYNVAVVAGWAMAVGTRVWGRRRAIGMGFACTVLYMYLAGMSAAVIRAGVMALLTLTAAFLGRRADAGWTLVTACGLMLAIKPDWISDIGFQLSVAATAGLVFINTSPGAGVISDFKTTVTAQITTIPLILHHFGNLSMISPVINCLTLWTIPVIMQVTAMAVAIGWLWDPAGWLLSLTVWPLLKYMLVIVDWGATWPGANLQAGKIGWGWVGLYYMTVIIIYRLLKYKIYFNQKG
jgi:competence protein ComEC